MQKFSLILIALLVQLGTAFCAEFVVEGTYQNKNLFVSNPVAAEGFGFCAYEVTVNGIVTTDEVNAATFEIDFSALSLTFGQPVVVVIKHKDNCEPTVANPSVLLPVSTFDCKEISVNDEGLISFSTTGERVAINFFIEQYKWNKWVKVGEVNGIGASKEISNNYSFKTKLIAGENKFLVSQQSFDGAIRSSQSATITSASPVVAFERNTKEMLFTFTERTNYEIVDMYGVVKMAANGDKVNYSKLTKGDYFLNFDNSSIPFTIK
ncbi:MAG: hypothetical protein ACKO7C_05195 [Bacteroidota bacterium]